MRHKKRLLFIFLLFCIFLCISSASAYDGNETDSIISQETVMHDLSWIQQSDNQTLQIQTDDELADAGTVYFDASAATDGDGSATNPYNRFSTYKISNGQTAYFADGVYEYQYTYGLNSGNVKFVGQSTNAVFKYTSQDRYAFIVDENCNLEFESITLDNVHIFNQGTVTATNTVFQNSIGFDLEPFTYYYTEYDCYGGAILSYGSATTVNINNCIFYANWAQNGGSLATYGTKVNIRNSKFYSSQARDYGGAIYAAYSDLTINNCEFLNANAKYGGAIYAENGTVNYYNSNMSYASSSSFGGALALRNVQLKMDCGDFKDCYSLEGAGGAVYAEYGDSYITNTDFTGCLAYFGGSICSLKANLTVNYCSFNDNMAMYGGAVYDMYESLDLYKSNFTNSYAQNKGGALYCAFLDSIKYNSTAIFVNSTAGYGDDFYIINNNYDGNEFIRFDIASEVVTPVITYNPTSPSTLPSRYDSRDYGYITPVRDQTGTNGCWDFGAIATLEACLKKATGIEYDLSEQNVKNIMTWYSIFGRNDEPNSGGIEAMFFSYLASWLGPINESVEELDAPSVLSDIHNPLIQVQNIYCLPIRKDTSDNDAIKRAIMDYGAVTASVFFETEYHTISLIGWDDDYRGTDYLGNYINGGWIFKNSWGEEWGDKGFGYMSYNRQFTNEYQSPNINFVYTFIFNATENYVRNYQYDFFAVNDIYTTSNSQVMYKNVFWAIDDEDLSAVSTFFREPTDYTIFVYYKDSLVLTQDGHSPAGYYTIPLSEKIPLSKGDEFSVAFRINNNGEKYIPLTYAPYSTRVMGTSGISFYYDGSSWCDLFTTNVNGTRHIACIKAFTTPKSLAKVTISATPFSSVELNQETEISIRFADSRMTGGLVTFDISGKTYYASVEDGQAILKVSFDKPGSYELSAQYKNNLYESNIIKFSFDVINVVSNITLTADDVFKYYGGAEKFTVLVFDGDSAVAGADVKVMVGNMTYKNNTDSNGLAIFDLDLGVGTYDVVTQYGGKSVYSEFIVNTTIYANDIAAKYGNTKLRAEFLDAEGAPLTGKAVKFTINGIDYGATTGSDGVASTNVDLNVDTYTVTAVNTVTGEEKKFKLQISKATTSISLTSSTAPASAIIMATLTQGADGSVVFHIGDDSYTRAIINGVATLNLTGLADGTYSVYAKYDGDDNFFEATSSTVQFTISDEDTITIIAPDATLYYGDVYKITLLKNNVPVSKAKINVTIDSDEYQVTTDENGVSSPSVSLTPKTYTFVCTYEGVSVSSSVTVKSTIEVDNVSSEYASAKASATFLDSKGIPLSNKEVQFYYGGVYYNTTTDANGYASMDVDLEPGSYTIYGINSVTDEYKKFKLTITKATPEISIESSTGDGSAIIVATLPSAATGNVVFHVEDKTYTRSISNGVATLSLTDMAGATYSAYAIYEGDENFNRATSATIEFTVKVTDTIKIIANDASIYYGGVYNITLLKNNVPVANAKIKVTIDSDEYFVTTGEDGVSSPTISLDPATYSFVCEYGGVSASSKVTVKSTIEATDITAEYASAKISATFRDSNGALLSNRDVQFYVDGDYRNATTNGKGVASLDVDLAPGSYNVYAINLVADEEYKKFKLTVEKATPEISLESSTGDGTATITAHLTSGASGSVVFHVGDSTYGRIIDNGVATLNLENLNDGTYSVYATYNGDYNFNKATSFTIQFTVHSTTVIEIVAPDVSLYYGGKFSVSVYRNGVAVTEGNVKLTAGSDVHEIALNSKGVASWNVELDPATYTFVSEYGGKSATSKVTVKSTVDASDASFTFPTAKATATFLDADGAALSNSAVAFEVDGRRYGTTTGSSGLASLNLDYRSPATYNVVAKNPATGEQRKFKVTIFKATPTISIASSTTGSSATIQATLTPDVSGSVVFTVGKTEYTRNIVNGATSLVLSDLADGTYSAYAKYVGNDCYNEVTSSQTMFTVHAVDIIEILAPECEIYFGAKYNVSVFKNGVKVVSGTLKFTINSVEYDLTTNSNGVASIYLKLDPDKYDVVCKYENQTVSSKVTVKSTVSAFDVTCDNTKVRATATFLDSAGKPVSNENVRFDVDDKSYTLKTDSNGVASIDVELASGTHGIYAVNLKTGEKKLSIITVRDDNYDVLVNSISKVYSDSKQLVIRVYDSKANPVVSKEVQADFYDANGVFYGYYIKNTDSNGYVKFNCNIVPGYYDVNVIVGDKEVSTSVNVKKMSTKIVASQKTFKVKSAKKYTVTLKTSKNKALSGKKVSIKVNGRTYSAKTKSNGKVVLNLKKLTKKGKFSAVIKFAGDKYYKSSKKTVKITVN